MKSTTHFKPVAALTIALTVILSSNSLAQNNTWLGGSGNWGNGSNWSQGVPGSPGQHALIDNGNGVDSVVTMFNQAFEVAHLTIDAGDVLEIQSFANLSVEDPNGMIINNGDLRIINNMGCAAALRIHDNTTLSGSGTITMGGDFPGCALIDNITGFNLSLTNLDSTIQGAGNIGVNGVQLVNDSSGLIDANDASDKLRLDPRPDSPHVNRGTMRASNGGRLALFEGAYDNIDGVIEALAGSTIELNAGTFESTGAFITGGTLQTSGDGLIEVSATKHATLINLNFAAEMVLLDNATVSLEGAINHSGILAVTSTGTPTRLDVDSPVVISGSGSINLDSTNAQIVGGGNLEIAGCLLTGIGQVIGTSTMFNGATIAPGSSIGTLTFFNTVDSNTQIVNDSIVEIEMKSTTGVPGTDWDFLDFTGTGNLKFDDDSLPSGVTIRLVSLDAGGDAGPLASFDPSSDFSIMIAQSNQFEGFAAENFHVDFSQFANETSGHFFVSLDDTDLLLNYEFALLGDVNGDGSVNLLDVAPFIDAISSGTFVPEADTNQDGEVNLLDVAGFIDILGG